MKITNQKPKTHYQSLSSVTYGSPLCFQEHNGRKITSFPGGITQHRNACFVNQHWTKRTFMIADIWFPNENKVVVVDVANGTCWKVDSDEQVEVLSAELVLL